LQKSKKSTKVEHLEHLVVKSTPEREMKKKGKLTSGVYSGTVCK